MKQTCQPEFEESLLSGYVDDELTQGDRQRVSVHLEDCAGCRTVVAEMREIRQAAMATTFAIPDEREWQEAPRSRPSAWTRRIGWSLIGVWLVGALWIVARALIAGSGDWLEKALVVGLASGLLFLFVSVLLDRLQALKHDRYRRVHK